MLKYVACVFVIILSGCASLTNTINHSMGYLRPTSCAIANGVLLTAKTPEERVKRANYLYSMATAVRAVSGSTAPSVSDLEASLRTFAPQSADDDWSQLIVSLSSLYQSVRPSIGGDTKAVLDALEQIASGLSDAAASYVK